MILIPAYNEAAHIGGLVARVRAVMPAADIVVVDDGSTDTTAAVARGAGAVVLPLPCNSGYGVALQAGYKYAQRRGFAYLVQLDGDGQHAPEGIPAMLERVQSGACDLCLGSRFLEGSTYPIPPLRRLGMMFFRRVASAILGQTITDPTTGFQAMNARVIDFFCHDRYPVDYPDTDVLVMVHRHGFRICECPVTMCDNPDGRSMHTGLRPFYYLFKMSLAIPLTLLRREAS